MSGIGSTRYFDASFRLIEWFIDERGDELNESEITALMVYYDLLRRTSRDIWDETPPKLTEKVGRVPLHDQYDVEWYQENY